tara:strand:- start:994 stop:2547 length:1554 start_codon:yes stop_codon:yes gene_type:complete
MASTQVVKGLLFRSTLNLKAISESSKSFSLGMQRATQLTRNITAGLNKSNLLKKKLISNDATFFKKRRENVRRKENESIIEASGISGAAKRSASVVGDSTKGFFGRVLDFLGYTLAGWLATRLPVIIKDSQKLLENLDRLVNMLFDFSSFLKGILTEIDFGVTQEESKFDSVNFMQTKQTLERAKDNINDEFDRIGSEIDEESGSINDSINEMNKENDKNKDKDKDKDKKSGFFGNLIESINPISRIRGMMNRAGDEKEDEEDKPKEEEVDAKKTVQPQEDLIPNKNKEEQNDRGPDLRGLDGEELSPKIEAEQEDALKQSGFEMYEEGTPRVPKDGLAFLHKDEAVIPKKSVDRYGPDFINRIIENKEEDNATKLKAARQLMEKLVGQFKEENSGIITVDEFDDIKEQTLGKLKKSFKGLTKEITEAVSTEANQDLLQAMKPTKDMMKTLAKELTVARKSSTIYMVNSGGSVGSGGNSGSDSPQNLTTSSNNSGIIVIDHRRDMYRRIQSTFYSYS